MKVTVANIFKVGKREEKFKANNSVLPASLSWVKCLPSVGRVGATELEGSSDFFKGMLSMREPSSF